MNEMTTNNKRKKIWIIKKLKRKNRQIDAIGLAPTYVAHY